MRYIKFGIAVLLVTVWAISANALEVDTDANSAVDLAYGGTNATSAAAARVTLGVEIGADVQAYSSVLDTYTGIDPSANIQSTLAAATYAAARALWDLEAGTDFYSISAADSAISAALAAFVGQTNLVTVGTIGTGAWEGTAIDGAYIDIAGTTLETTIAADDEVIIYDTSAGANRSMTRGNFVTGIGAGQAIIFDIGDDGGNDSTDVGEIATSGDTNSIFTEPSADKILIDLSNNWPGADLADVATEANAGDSATAFFDAGNVEHEYGGLEADVNAYDGLLGITGGTTTEVNTAAELETFAGLGAFANEYLDDADASTMRTTLGLAIATDVLAPDGDGSSLTGVATTASDNDVTGVWTWADDTAIEIGGTGAGTADWTITYEATGGELEFTHAAGLDADVIFDLNDTSDSVFTITNTDATAVAGLVVEGDITYSGSLTYGGSGDSYIRLNDNTTYTPTGYEIYFRGTDLYSAEAGVEKGIVNVADNHTITGSWNMGGAAIFEIPNAADPTTDEFGEIAGDNDAWAASRGAVEFFDGTASTWLVGTLTTDTPTNGQVPKWNTGGTITWENDADSGGAPDLNNVADPTAATSITMDATAETITFDYSSAFSTGNQFAITTSGNVTGGTLFSVTSADADIGYIARFGDGTNMINVTQAGELSNSSGGVVNMAAGSDYEVNGSPIDYDDMAGLVSIPADAGITIADSQTLIFDESAVDPNDADVTLSGADGVLTITSVNGANNENLTIDVDQTADEVVITSSTGANLNFSALNMATTGTINGAVNINTDANGMTSGEMTTAGMYGTMFIATGAGTWNLPAAAAGMGFCVYSTTAAAVIINPDDADVLVYEGTADTAGHQIASASGAGDFICFLAIDTTNWHSLGHAATWVPGS